MSFDLMVFDPTVAPSDSAQFARWYELQVQWSEGHGYDSTGNTTPALASWYREMIRVFPAMNGPDAFDGPYDSAIWDLTADYCIGRSVIYVAFAWNCSEQAQTLAWELARKHGVGFYNVSDDEPMAIFP
jgi:hypothetical protein